jgi:hypothetical protein
MANSRDREIDRTITSNLHRLSKYGVLAARPEYENQGPLINRQARCRRDCPYKEAYG